MEGERNYMKRQEKLKTHPRFEGEGTKGQRN